MDFRMKFDNDASIAYGQEEQNCQINGKLLDSLFEEFIDKNPELADEVCIEEFGTKTTVSYRELNSRANKLARVLIDKVKLVYLQNNIILIFTFRKSTLRFISCLLSNHLMSIEEFECLLTMYLLGSGGKFEFEMNLS